MNNDTIKALKNKGYKVSFITSRPNLKGELVDMRRIPKGTVLKPRGGQVICQISWQGKIVEGKALCNDATDIFKTKKGRELALERAVAQLVPLANKVKKKKRVFKVGDWVQYRIGGKHFSDPCQIMSVPHPNVAVCKDTPRHRRDIKFV